MRFINCVTFSDFFSEHSFFSEFGENLSVYDLSPIVVKDVVAALLTRKYWHLLYVILELLWRS